MGCSAAKNLAVEPLNGTDGVEEPKKVSVTRRASEVPPLEGEEPQTELLDGGTVNNVQKTPNGLSFDIAFEESEGGDSIIRKHPPKRFQKLEEQQTSPNLSLARLQEKLDEAEIRRQQILQQRVASAKVRKALKRQNNLEDGEDDEEENDDEKEDPNSLKVPPDITGPTNPYDVSYI